MSFIVWDVQSLVSINPRDRKQYVRAVRSLLKVNLDTGTLPFYYILSYLFDFLCALSQCSGAEIISFGSDSGSTEPQIRIAASALNKFYKIS
jgi:hypothetical protein